MRGRPIKRTLRQCLGIGTPRRLQGRAAGVWAVFIAVWARLGALWGNHEPDSLIDRFAGVAVLSCYPSANRLKHRLLGPEGVLPANGRTP